MIYSFLYNNTLYNQLNLRTEVFDSSFIVGDDLDNLTQFVFNRTPTFGVSIEQLDKLGYYLEPVLTSDPTDSYELFRNEVSQKVKEMYDEQPIISINFNQFSSQQNLDGVQKWVTLNPEFKKNLKQTILEKYKQNIIGNEAEVLVKMVLLLYKEREGLSLSGDLGIKKVLKYEYQNGQLVLQQPASLTEQEPETSSTITTNPLDN